MAKACGEFESGLTGLKDGPGINFRLFHANNLRKVIIKITVYIFSVTDSHFILGENDRNYEIQ